MAAKAAPEEKTLDLRRTFPSPRQEVFRAWTEPKELKRWFCPSGDFSTLLAEVDLRVGGSYRIGIKPPDKDVLFIVSGTYQEVTPPERLVFTWSWEGTEMDVRDTLVTVEFIERGEATEVVLKHELLPTKEARDKHEWGWNGCLTRLAEVL